MQDQPTSPVRPEAAEPVEPAGPSGSLREATVRGVRWVLVARVAAEIFAFAAAVALARMVPPAEFGRAAVPLAVVPLAVILTFEGCASALVQRKSINRADRESAIIMSLVVGFVLSALVFLLAVPVGEPLFGARVAGLLELVSPVFLIASFGAVPRAMMWRSLDFRRVSLAEIVSLAVGASVAIALAADGFDAEAVIGGALAGTAANSVMLFAAAPFTLRRGNRESTRGIAGFGIPAALAGLVHVAFANAAYVILAARVTAAQTGLYWRAFQLGVTYQEKVSGIMLRLAFPVYARTKDPDELRHFHERATRLHATLVAPLLALLIVVAPVLIPWLLGEPWRGAVVPTQILAGAGMIAAILTGYPQVMLAVGRPGTLLKFNVGILALNVGVVFATVSHGIIAVSIGVVAVHVAILFGVYGLLLHRYVGVPMRRLATDVAPALTGGAAVLACGFPFRILMTGVEAPEPVTLFSVGILAAVVYLATIRSLFRSAWSDVTLLVRQLLPSLTPAHRSRSSSALSSAAP